MNGKLGERVQFPPPTQSQSKFLCHKVATFLHLLPCVHPVHSSSLFFFQFPTRSSDLNPPESCVDLGGLDAYLFPFMPIEYGMGKCIIIWDS